MLSNLAKHGWSTNSMIQKYLDGILAPTAYWYVANASRKLRTSDATTATTDFDQYWMNILLPTKTYNDIYSGWSQNQRFRAVARLEYLRSRYCNTAVYNNAKTIMRNGITSDDTDLPTRQEIVRTFGMEEWAWDNKNNVSNGDIEDQYKHNVMQTRLQTKDNSYDLNSPIIDWGLEDVLEVGGCCVHGRSEFNLFAEEHQLYEVLSLDYVEALTAHIRKIRAAHPEKKHFQVVEVGAGSGSLTHHIKRCLARDADGEGDQGIDIIATDSGAWNLGKRFAVEPYTNKEALSRLRPDLVLVSWMPAGTDWTKSFRRAGVKNYLVCGEADDGCTGHNWETWGNVQYKEDGGRGQNGATPLYKQDGYERTDLNDLALLQLQRYDCKQAPYQSTTVLFSKH
jgi:hypothetical protein